MKNPSGPSIQPILLDPHVTGFLLSPTAHSETLIQKGQSPSLDRGVDFADASPPSRSLTPSTPLLQETQSPPLDACTQFADASQPPIILPRSSLERALHEEPAGQSSLSHTHPEPHDQRPFSLQPSGSLEESTIRVLPFSYPKDHSAPSDLPALTKVQSYPFTEGIIRVLNLEDKVPSGAGSIVKQPQMGLNRPKRDIQKPSWIKDFI
ncbi:acyl transferase domain-containing protein [Sesbania bispinosa]|nr:acyl transferase domain-containing protein [Sesbania bispinosa]